MSYILDALRRADSERERGAVPNLHAKPVLATLADGDDEGEARRAQPLLWVVIGLSLALVALLAWQFLGRNAVQPAPAPPVLAEVLPPPAPVVAAAPPQAAEPEPRPATTPAPALAPPLNKPKPPVLTSAQEVERAKPAKSGAKTEAPASALDDRQVLSYAGLPEHIRRELPQLVIGGAMYSQTPANRMLILNGQVFHEGDKVAGELVLEQIKLKSAVLAYKGYRYSINY